MTDILIYPNDVCLAKYINNPILSLETKMTVHAVCGNCYLSFSTDKYMLETRRHRYVANCPHCGKWNKMNLFTEGYRDIYELF